LNTHYPFIEIIETFTKKEVFMTRQAVIAPNTPTAGPYSHGVWSGNTFYLSGQAAVDPAIGKLVEGDVAVQTGQCFRNLFAVLAAAGLTPQNVIKVNVYLIDMNDFGAMNVIYTQQFEKPYPARTTVGVAALPLGAKVEIELIAAAT
jgi:2-iminobutanoate/2-iminopropanoate deaminase